MKFWNKLDDLGGWFLFFFLLYLISFIKLTSRVETPDDYFFTIYSVIIAVYILSRFLFAYFHKSLPFDPAYEPSVAFVIPAKNEADNIGKTIEHTLLSNYPKEKLEVITINDGSTDGTYQAMLAAAERGRALGVRVEVVNWIENQGKRPAMAEGVRRSKHEIIVFVDSDSFIDKDCVRHLVKYFNNPLVGAVSGHTDVYNRETNLLTKMQALRYYVAFHIYKAAESVFGSVTCCPGCCSAYRRAYLTPILDAWLNQSFMGVKCTFGDDRSLTNFIIRQYDSVYSPEAQAETVVPETFRKYVKQQQRWKKSWIRETFIASSFIWRKNILASLSFYSYIFLSFAGPIVFLRAVFYVPFFQSHTLPLAYLLGLLTMLLLHGIYYHNHVKKAPWFLPAITFWFYTVMLMWQLPYAFISMRDVRWGTR